MSFSLKQSSSIQKTLQTKYLLSTIKTASLKKRRAGVFTSFINTSFINASLTVEASIVLTIFLIISYCIIYPFFILNIHIKLQSAVEYVVKKDAQYAYCSLNDYEIKDTIMKIQYQDIINNGLSLDNIKLQIQDRILQEPSTFNIIRNISYEGSNVLNNNQIIDLAVHYQVEIPFPVNHVENLIVRSRRRVWIGNGDFNKQDNKDTVFVYIAENGRVYHLYEDCTYLKLSIHAVDYGKIHELRNEAGGIYYPCEHCHPQKQGTVYITDDGNRYHSNLLCSGLKRKIRKVSIDEVGDKPLCSRCQLRSGK